MFKVSLNKTKEEPNLELYSASTPSPNLASRLFEFFRQRPEYLLLLILNLLVFARLFSPHVTAISDWVFWDKNTLQEYKYLTVWGNQEGLGRDELYAIPHVFQQFLLYYLSFSSVISNLSDHFFWFLILPVFSNISAWIFFEKISGSRIVVFFATLLYTVNTEYLSRLAGGHNLLWFGYALAPLIMWLFILAVEKHKLFYFLISGCVVAFAFTYDFRTDLIFSIFFSIFIAWQFLMDTTAWRDRFIFFFKGVLCIVIVPILLLAFFLVPTFFTSPPSLPPGNTSLTALETFSYADFWHSLTVVDPFWPTFAVFNIKFPVPILFYSLPLLALIALWLRRRDKYVIFFAGVYVISVFLAKGSNAPFGEVNDWIFTHIPGFFAFREATKFYMLVSLSLSFLFAVGLEEIYKFIENRQFVMRRVGLSEFATNAFLVTTLAIFVVMMSPAFFQQVQGNFVSFSLPQWQQQLEASQTNDNHFYRTLWVPSRENISPFSSTHPVISADSLSGDPSTRPFVQLSDAAPDTNWTYLHQPASANLLNLLGVKYIYVPNTDYQKVFTVPPANETSKTPAQLRSAKTYLDSLSWLQPVTTTTTLIPAYQLNNTQDRLFTTKSRTYVVGPDDFFAALGTLPKFDFASQTMVPLNKKWNTSVQAGSNLIFNQSTLLDYTVSQIAASDLIEPYKVAGVSENVDASKTWNKIQLTNKYDYGNLAGGLQSYDFDYSKGVVYTRSNTPLKFSFDITSSQAGADHLLFRTLDNDNETDLGVSIDDQTFSLKAHSNHNATFHWYDLGIGNFTSGKHTMTITSKNGLAVLNLVELVRDSNFKIAQDKTATILAQSDVMQIEKIDATTFSRSNPVTLASVLTWNIVKSGKYSPSIHVPDSATLTKIAIAIDGKRVVSSLKEPETGALRGQGSWFDLAPLYLTEGSHQVSIELQDAPVQNFKYQFPLDYVLLNQGNQTYSEYDQSQTQPANISYDYLSPTKYLVHVKNASRPFDLVFAETFNDNWGATYSTAKGQKPEEAYEMLQAYHLNQTGNFDVTIEYRPQKFVYVGMIMSAFSLLLVIGALVLFRRKGW